MKDTNLVSVVSKNAPRKQMGMAIVSVIPKYAKSPVATNACNPKACVSGMVGGNAVKLSTARNPFSAMGFALVMGEQQVLAPLTDVIAVFGREVCALSTTKPINIGYKMLLCS